MSFPRDSDAHVSAGKMESGGPIEATASVQIKLEVFKICRDVANV